jgi:hypothetical protein
MQYIRRQFQQITEPSVPRHPSFDRAIIIPITSYRIEMQTRPQLHSGKENYYEKDVSSSRDSLVLFANTAGAEVFTLKSDQIGGQLTIDEVYSGFGCTGKNISPQNQLSQHTFIQELQTKSISCISDIRCL